MKPLSLALYTYSTVPRGSVVHTACLAEALHDAGWDVTVYALDKDRRGFFRPLRGRLCLIPAGPAPSTTADLVRQRAGELAAFMERRAAAHDIHHAQDCLTANGLLSLRLKGISIAMVRTVHHVERFDDVFLADCQERSIRQASMCLTVSEASERDVRRAFGVRALRVTNGVDLGRFAAVDPARVAALRAGLGVRSGPVLLAFGGVEERKNTLRVLRAFARVRGSHPRAELWIVGGATVLDHGAYREAFLRELDSMPAPARAAVRELGVVAEDDVPALLRLASVAVVASLHEGFGLAALEALAAGVPLVASDRPPLTELLDASCAELVDPLSEESIAGGLRCALDGAGPRPDALRKRAQAYSWSRVAAQHVEHYDRLLAGRFDPRPAEHAAPS